MWAEWEGLEKTLTESSLQGRLKNSHEGVMNGH